jgi:hypothetical protein
MFLACTFFCPKRPPDERALGLPLGAIRRHRAAQRGHPPRQRPAYARTKATDYQLPPGMSVNAAIARAWDAMLAAHHEWHKALSRFADCDPAIK